MYASNERVQVNLLTSLNTTSGEYMNASPIIAWLIGADRGRQKEKEKEPVLKY